MGDFKKRVQTDKITGPLRRTFSEKSWKEDFDKTGTDAEDQNLFEAGIAVHSKAQAIRAVLPMATNESVSATTKLRAIAAISNHNVAILHQKSQAAYAAAEQEAKLEHKLLALQEVTAQKIRLPSGYLANPSDIFEASVDGIALPVKSVLLPNSPNLNGNPKFSKVDWGQVMVEVNLGVLYDFVEDIWDDCLWNGYEIHRQGARWLFKPGNSAIPETIVATRARANNLSAQFMGMAQKHQEDLINQGMLPMANFQDVRDVKRDGKKQLIALASASREPSETIKMLFTLRALASEPYYDELLNEPQKLLEQASFQQLLSAWTVISGASSVLQQAANADTRRKDPDADPLQWLPAYASILKNDALEAAIRKAAACTLAQARAIVNFLTFKGANGQEIWAHPLIPVSPTATVPVIAALSAPNLRRLVDIWLRQLGVDLSLRGPAFEAHMRSVVTESIASSPVLAGSAACLKTALNFTPTEGRKEEIDLVFCVGSLAFICELKCILAPAEAKQVAVHRRTVAAAVVQVQRKAEAVNADKPAFRERLRAGGIDLPEAFTAVPLVILSSAIHAGYAVDGVGIADEYIISVFFEGELRDAVLQEANGQMRTIRKTVLYTSTEEAIAMAPAYFVDPPQMKLFKKGLQERRIPIAAVSEDDWSGISVTFDCTPRADIQREELEPVGEPGPRACIG